MISTFLVAHPWLSPTALVLLALLGPLVGWWLASRPRAAWVLTGVALLPVAALTLVPVDRELFARCETAWTLPTVGRVELAANVVLFVAPALLASVATRRPVLVAVAASALAAGLETVQALAPALGRSCSTDDWLSNSLGALFGAALGWVALRLAGPYGRPRSRSSRGEIGL
ncbi:VanZ family protein [Mumia sp. DW29H23]|uniref:VanZ family protein n=1 Tax=Mumia sp. DW29H23 TaxID=3421241 RepID=UPI003D68EC38